MKTNRRDFIKTTGFGAVGLGVLPSLNLFAKDIITSLPRKSPESQGVDSVGIRQFLKATKESGLEWHSFMLVRHGNVVAEGWWKPFEAANKHTLYSLSKSFTGSAIGFLVTEGKITINDQVISFFPEHTPANASDNLKAMKIKHLLTMNTGHHTDSMPDIRAKPDQNWVKSFLEKPVEHEPGTFFMYNTGATYMLGAIVHKVTGQTLEEYLAPRLFKPLGITGYDWEKSPQGLNTAGYGLRVSTEDIAKFGQLYLQKGRWQGKQLLPAAWVEEATGKRTTSQAGDNDWSQGYGYQFWRCKPGFYRGDGAYGQFCMVMPEQNAVLVMTCESFNLQKTMDVAYQTILPALKNEKLPENSSELTALNADIAALTLPVPKGKTSSPVMNKYSDKVFNVEKNAFGLTQIGFGLFEDAGVLRVNYGNGMEKVGFGWEKWKVNPNKRSNPFSANPIVIPSRIAGTATWLADNILQINFKFVDQVHGDKLTVTFEGNNVTVALLSSISENTKNNPEKREIIKGILA
ncbi:serine hydrolase domain-containing protein [Runella slithyformis]|uniref:Beta-lactamase n=1 Tax=Runella slithyformis (strain ATCC 29530 / DSM 19594 / LMG 11500 / NCIMB 11436 / LSU 4) TaxID=761193 RepID=A0A7U4E647_RUNSL|nr:serine hydrolase [Runella slithyformis]AEI48969.1 beta-lactamase [Runella slithyformis DSM 19594]